jgi:predicted  nucleic acid-binding Zn-ribbon protein
MVAKSVIEIDVNDESFKRFQQAFDRYQKILDQQSKKWEQVNKSFDAINKKQKDFNKSISDGTKGLKDAAYTTGTIARNMASAALSAAKWVAFGAVGGGFGLGGIAASASDYRRTAQGLGVSTGQLRAANVGFGRYINPESTLGNIADIASDVSRQQILARLGAQPGQNAAQNLPSIIQNAVGQFKAGGQSKQFAEALGLTQVFSLEELRRLASLNEQELQKVIAQYKKDAEALKVDDADSRAWQDFWVALKRAGNTIETSLIKNLAPLTPKLQELSEAVSNAIGNFLSSKDFKKSIDDFIGYLNSPEGKQAISDFFEGIKIIAAFIGKTFGAIPEVKRGLTIFGQNVFGGGASTNQALQYFMDAKLTKNQATGLVANLYAESGLNPTAVGDSGKAYGIAQWHPDRQAEFERVYGKSIKGSSLQEQLNFVAYELQHKEKNALEQLLKAKTTDEAVKAGLAYERPANYSKELSRRTEIANSIDVKVFNNTGGNAIATVQAMPGVSR